MAWRGRMFRNMVGCCASSRSRKSALVGLDRSHGRKFYTGCCAKSALLLSPVLSAGLWCLKFQTRSRTRSLPFPFTPLHYISYLVPAHALVPRASYVFYPEICTVSRQCFCSFSLFHFFRSVFFFVFRGVRRGVGMTTYNLAVSGLLVAAVIWAEANAQVRSAFVMLL